MTIAETDPPAVHDPDADDHVVGGHRTRESFFAQHGLSTADVLIIGLAFFLCTAFTPFLLAPSWTPRAALVLAALPVGGVSLAVRVKRRERTAIIATLALVWALVSALQAEVPLLAIKGTIGREASLVMLVASIGLWSLGSELSVRGKQVLLKALLAALALNAAVGIGQVLLRPQRGALALLDGRAHGLANHPVYFGALMAAGVGVSVATWTTRREWASAGLVVLFAGAASVSGSRVALVAGLAVTLFCGGFHGIRRACASAAAFIVGTAAGVYAASHVPVSGVAQPSAIGRMSTTGSNTSERLQLWRYGWKSVLDNPVFGTGVGNFRAATQGRYSAEFTAASARSDVAPWFDAHNVVVEFAVATGLVGLLLFSLFVASAVWRARGPFVAAAAAIAITWLLEPAALITLPLACLLVGVAGVEPPVFAGGSTKLTRTAGVCVGLGLLCMAGLLVADLRLKQAVDSGDPQRIEAAIGPFWRDPIASDLVAQSLTIDGLEDRTVGTQAVDWSRRSTDYEPTRPGWWDKLAARQFFFGDAEAARESLERSLELQPWRIESWNGMLNVATATNDATLEARAREALCVLGEPGCTEKSDDNDE